MYNMTILLN